ncbi:Uncharacterised protein [Vibrio cholerae]|nr:Uncharacterised protein [Vibrio cholerae]
MRDWCSINDVRDTETSCIQSANSRFTTWTRTLNHNL